MRFYYYDKKTLEFKKVKTGFIYILFLITFFAWTLLSYSLYNPNININYKTDKKVKNINNEFINNINDTLFERSIKYIKNNKWNYTDRKKLNKILYPYYYHTINTHIKNNNIDYLLSVTELTGIILTISQTETGSSKGEPYTSILFKKGNNISGIKGKGINNIQTFEYIDNEKVVIFDNFMVFSTTKECIIYILNMWQNNRYVSLHSCINYNDFFMQLGKCGYYTYSDENNKTLDIWNTIYEKYYIPIINK